MGMMTIGWKMHGLWSGRCETTGRPMIICSEAVGKDWITMQGIRDGRQTMKKVNKSCCIIIIRQGRVWATECFCGYRLTRVVWDTGLLNQPCNDAATWTIENAATDSTLSKPRIKLSLQLSAKQSETMCQTRNYTNVYRNWIPTVQSNSSGCHHL